MLIDLKDFIVKFITDVSQILQPILNVFSFLFSNNSISHLAVSIGY